jgi:oligopeptide/dipeptide ABC transporter ATP-binding protein
MKDPILLEIRSLKKHFNVHTGFFSEHHDTVKAVDGVDLQISRGETVGLVGESGCGKTTLGQLIAGLEKPTEGKILFNGEDISLYPKNRLRNFRREVQFIFQDPFSSLNPRMTAGAIIGEPLAVHGLASAKKRKDRVFELLDIVGLSKNQADRYPHEFSGGQRQRIGIARALALDPKLIVADEPVSALDVSIQAQILNLLEDLQEEFDLTYLFISHDLGVVEYVSDRIAVMYLGKIVEISNASVLYRKPFHPYTKALLSAVPVLDPEAKRNRIILKGDVPSPINPPSGCSFHTRCPCRIDICDKTEPPISDKGEGHLAACHLEP